MALKHLWKEGRRVGQVCSIGHRQQTLLARRTLAHPGPSLTKKMGRSTIRGYRPQYVSLPHENSKFNRLTPGKRCSNTCSRSQRIRRHTRSARLSTARYRLWCRRRRVKVERRYYMNCFGLLLAARRVYYIFATMASLNKWRRAREFSKLSLAFRASVFH